jgi:hypothetical protein
MVIKVPYVTAATTLFSFGLIFGFGHLRDSFRALLRLLFSSAAAADSPAGCNSKVNTPSMPNYKAYIFLHGI